MRGRSWCGRRIRSSWLQRCGGRFGANAGIPFLCPTIGCRAMGLPSVVERSGATVRPASDHLSHRIAQRLVPSERGLHQGLSLMRPSRFPAPAAGVAVGWIDGGAVDPQLVLANQRLHDGGVAEGDRRGDPE